MGQHLGIAKPALGPAGSLPNSPDGTEDDAGLKNRPATSLSQKVMQVSWPRNVGKFTSKHLFCLYFPFYASTRENCDKTTTTMSDEV